MAAKEIASPKAAQLADTIKAFESEVATASERVNQAERAATAVSHDADAHDAARGRLKDVQADYARKNERLAHLKRAHADAVAREKEFLVNGLKSRLESTLQAQKKARDSVFADRQAEETRHGAALSAFKQREAEIDGMHQPAARALHLAVALGMGQEQIEKIGQLEESRRAAAKKLDDSGVFARRENAAYELDRVVRIETSLGEVAAVNPGPAGGYVEDYAKQIKDLKSKFAAVDAEYEQLKRPVDELTAQLRELGAD